MTNKKVNNEVSNKQRAVSRLNRINGQINAIKKMIDERRTVEDVLIQLSAVESAIKGLTDSIIEDYINSYVKENIKKSPEEITKEIVTLLRRYE